jgi:uncharacterized membrane protein YhdT
MDRFLASAHHKWPYGVLYPAVPQRKATEQALEMVGLTVAFIVVGVNSSAFASGALMGVLGPIRNPLGIEGFTQVYEALLYTMAPLLSVAAALSVFTRLRRATGVERQQVKWFVYAAAANISGIILAYVIPGVIDMPVWFEQVGFALNIITLPAIPAAIGIAILRYRLYEIDLIINRTLVYGALTVLLALIYFGGVTLLQGGLRNLLGHESTLSIVATTLAIAALFNPLRHRIQSFIDRRFYRSKYDSRRTLETFSTTLRNETDLNALSGILMGVVRETMQPAYASLWLRPGSAPRQSEGSE